MFVTVRLYCSFVADFALLIRFLVVRLPVPVGSFRLFGLICSFALRCCGTFVRWFRSFVCSFAVPLRFERCVVRVPYLLVLFIWPVFVCCTCVLTRCVTFTSSFVWCRRFPFVRFHRLFRSVPPVFPFVRILNVPPRSMPFHRLPLR